MWSYKISPGQAMPILYLLFLSLSFMTQAQVVVDPTNKVVIGLDPDDSNADPTNQTAHPSAKLDIRSDTFGFLMPRMTDAQMNAIVSPAEGLEIYNKDEHKPCIYNGTIWKCQDEIVGPEGPQGPVGPQGPAGNDGADGADGAQGPAGNDGADGADGATGAVGPQGPVGNDGADGADGAQGPTGPQGPAGNDGVDGADGATGPVGPQGQAGNDGADGVDGAVGPVGPQGPAGNDGADGADGAVGPVGPQGPAGNNGADGTDGAVGPEGPQGPPGVGIAQTISTDGTPGNLTLSDGGGTLTINTADTDDWSLDGNSTTTGKRLGSLDNEDLSIVTNGIERLRIDTAGRLITNFSTGSISIGNGGGTTTSENSCYIGHNAALIASGNNNIVFGHEAAQNMTNGSENSLIGFRAGQNLTEGILNVAIGFRAGLNLGLGQENLLLGTSAGEFSNGSSNVFVGSNSGLNTSGNNNTFIGRGSVNRTCSGIENTMIGSFVGSSGTTSDLSGNSNVAIGVTAARNLTTGSNNLVIASGASLTTGNNNIIIKTGGPVSGDRNILIGGGGGLTSGSDNFAFGSGVFFLNNALTNCGGLGASSVQVNASNKFIFGGPNVNNGAMTVEAFSFNEFSDARFKININSDIPGLAFITKLNPVSYVLDATKYQEHVTKNLPVEKRRSQLSAVNKSTQSSKKRTGFLAQDVEKICSELNFEFDGIHVPESDIDNYSLSYSSFVVPLVKAVQEQQEQIESLQKKVNKQDKQLAEYKALLDKALHKMEKHNSK